MTTADIESILNIEHDVQKEYPMPYLAMKGKGWYLKEILNRFNKHHETNS